MGEVQDIAKHPCNDVTLTKEISSLWSPELFPKVTRVSFSRFTHTLYIHASIYIHPHFISFYAQMGTNPTQCSAVCILGSLSNRTHTPMGLWWLTSLSDVNFSVYHNRNPRAFKQASSWSHPWFHWPRRNLSTYKLPGNINQDFSLEEMALPVTRPPDPLWDTMSHRAVPFHQHLTGHQLPWTTCTINHTSSLSTASLHST